MLGPHRFFHRVESGHVGRNLCFDIPQNRSLCSRLSFQKELEKDEEMCVESIEKLTVHFREVYLFFFLLLSSRNISLQGNNKRTGFVAVEKEATSNWTIRRDQLFELVIKEITWQSGNAKQVFSW
jgi:hypothetical protein